MKSIRLKAINRLPIETSIINGGEFKIIYGTNKSILPFLSGPLIWCVINYKTISEWKPSCLIFSLLSTCSRLFQAGWRAETLLETRTCLKTCQQPQGRGMCVCITFPLKQVQSHPSPYFPESPAPSLPRLLPLASRTGSTPSCPPLAFFSFFFFCSHWPQCRLGLPTWQLYEPRRTVRPILGSVKLL